MFFYLGLKYSFAHEIARENLSLSCFIESLEFPYEHFYSDIAVKNN